MSHSVTFSMLQDPGGQQIGFLLGSLNISVALTSESTGKALPKEDGKDTIVHFKGWPRLTWFVTEHLPKPPKDWAPPQRPQPDTPAYVEVMLILTHYSEYCYHCATKCCSFPMQYSSAKDGSALGVTVTRSALLTHCRSLTTACLYKEGASQYRLFYCMCCVVVLVSVEAQLGGGALMPYELVPTFEVSLQHKSPLLPHTHP